MERVGREAGNLGSILKSAHNWLSNLGDFSLLASVFLLCRMGAKLLALPTPLDFCEEQKRYGCGTVVQTTNGGIIMKPVLW